MADVDANPLAPVENGVEIPVRHRELRAQEILVAIKVAGEIGEAAGQRGTRSGLRFLGRCRVEQRAEALVHFGVDERQPFLQAIALERSGCRCKTEFGLEIGDVLDDRWPFAQAFAVVEFEHRDVAFGIDGKIVAAIRREFVVLQVNLDQLEIYAGLAQGDMR